MYKFHLTQSYDTILHIVGKGYISGQTLGDQIFSILTTNMQSLTHFTLINNRWVGLFAKLDTNYTNGVYIMG